MPKQPTPQAARYNATGEPKPPAPTTKIDDCDSFLWPSTPKSGSRRWRLYR
uniref:MOCS3-2 n=1 Tax=Arundo donax TaxID=35708 RepID=A0A0A9HHX9_ARUDO